MSKFAKLFESDNNDQVLVVLNTPESDGSGSVTYHTEHKELRYEVKLPFDTPEAAEDYFNSVDRDEACNGIKSILNIR